MDKMTEKDGGSLDIVNENLEVLKTIFPDAFKEDGVDFDTLRQLLGDEIDEGEEKYGLNWHGKKKARQIALTPSTGTLRPCPEESIDWSTTQNLFIEGDNLEVLKLLQKSYAGKVKMIYIDPPYNTGKEFIYPDRFQDNLDTYLKYTGQKSDAGFKLSSNTESSGRYHTNWLSMMYPRLKLARNLLRNDGVIYISIDDNEIANLMKLCDEIFGEENFVNAIAIKMSESTGVKMSHVDKRLPKLKEYILFYKKAETKIFPVSIPKDKWDNEYKHLILGVTKEELENLKNIMFSESSTDQNIVDADRICRKMSMHPIDTLYQNNNAKTEEEKLNARYQNAWRIVRDVATTGGAKDLADKKKGETDAKFFIINTPKNKKYLIKSDYSDSAQQPRIKLLFADSYLTLNPGDFWQDIKTTGLDNEGYVDFKNGKKPLKMLHRLLKQSSDKEDLVLDFFSGSCTTAHAVLELNMEDSGKRKFIMVQLPESCDEKSEVFKAGYKTIAEIGKDRMRRAAKKIKEKNLKYKGDLGFKVFKLDSSNIRAWNPDRGDLEQTLLDHTEHLVDGRSEQDLLYELLLKRGVDLTIPIEEKQVSGKTVYSIGYGVLFACLDTAISRDEVAGLGQDIIAWHKELEPASDTQVVFRDSAFSDDISKTNMTAILEQHGIAHVRSL